MPNVNSGRKKEPQFKTAAPVGFAYKLYYTLCHHRVGYL